MGWMGCDIMDGDTPMDYAWVIREEILGLHGQEDEDEAPEPTKDDLHQKADAIDKWCEGTGDPIAYEVWGQMLIDAESERISGTHREAILCAIDQDIVRTNQQGWKDPVERKHYLRLLHEKVWALGTGRVVRLPWLHKRRLAERVQNAMQGAPGTADPNIIPKAVAWMLTDLESGGKTAVMQFSAGGATLEDWGWAVGAMVIVGKALGEARDAGVPLEDAIETARQEVDG